MSSPGESITPVMSVWSPPAESRPAPADYKDRFDADVAIATATSLRLYLTGLSVEEGCEVRVSGEDRQIECRGANGSSLSIEVFGDDVFDMHYSPAEDQLIPLNDRIILGCIMPGYDSDHVAAYARHYLRQSKIEI